MIFKNIKGWYTRRLFIDLSEEVTGDVSSLFDKRYPDRVAVRDLTTALQLNDITVINALEPDSKYRINPDDPAWKELYKRYGADFPELVKMAVLVILQKKHQGVFIEQTFGGLTIELVANIDIKIHDHHYIKDIHLLLP